MMTNRKFVVQRVEARSSGGITVQVPTTLAGPFEGYYHDGASSKYGIRQPTRPEMDRPANHSLTVNRNYLYNNLTGVVVDFSSWYRDGAFIRITHRRHPKTKMWIPIETNKQKQFIIAELVNDNFTEEVVILGLKDKPK